MGDCVQLQNLVGHSPLKSDRAGIILSCNGHSSYNVKIIGSRTVTMRNRSTLRRIDPRSVPGYYEGMENLFSVQAPSVEHFHGLSQQRAKSSEPGQAPSVEPFHGLSQ